MAAAAPGVRWRPGLSLASSSQARLRLGVLHAVRCHGFRLRPPRLHTVAWRLRLADAAPPHSPRLSMCRGSGSGSGDAMIDDREGPGWARGGAHSVAAVVALSALTNPPRAAAFDDSVCLELRQALATSAETSRGS